MSDALAELSHYDEYDYIIINDQFEKALQDLRCVLHAQHLTRGQQGGLVSAIR
jgi:guanylate kinase